VANPSGQHGNRLALLFWILVAAIFFYFSYTYIHFSMNDQKLSEYLTHAVDLAASQHRPPKELRELILVNAEELGLPIQGDQIKITGLGANMNVSVTYEVGFTAPFSSHVLYRKSFKHDVTYHAPY
jgi:hypothetical protein